MSIAIKIGGVLAVLLAAGGIWYVTQRPDPPAAEEISRTLVPPPPEPQEEEWEPVEEEPDPPPRRNSAPTTPEPEPSPPLPSLGESDLAVTDAFASLEPSDVVTAALTDSNLLRKVVVTVDNLTTGEVARKLRAVDVPEQPFAVTRTGGTMLLGKSNYERYDPYVDFVAALDAEQISRLFERYSPLLDEAYAELGYPDRPFVERVVEVIDHLMDVPQPSGPIHLAQPNVVYEFADPELEGASAGHKLLLRMGEQNAGRVLAKLREIRAALTDSNA